MNIIYLGRAYMHTLQDFFRGGGSILSWLLKICCSNCNYVSAFFIGEGGFLGGGNSRFSIPFNETLSGDQDIK